MSYIEAAARMIADTADSSKIVVEKSTVPVKAAESVTTILRTNHRKGVKYQVIMTAIFRLNIDEVLMASGLPVSNCKATCLDHSEQDTA